MELIAAAMLVGLCVFAGLAVLADAIRPFFRGIDRDEEDAETARFLILKQEIKAMSEAWDAIREEVNRNRNVIESAVTLINGLADRIEEANDSQDPTAVDDLVAEIRASTDSLAAAVAANTPGAISDATEPADAETETTAVPLDGETVPYGDTTRMGAQE